MPSLPGCYSQGDALEEAIAMVREAIELHLDGMIADGEPAPAEDAMPETAVVTVEVAA